MGFKVNTSFLRLVGTEIVCQELIKAARRKDGDRTWVYATLGRLEPSTVRKALGQDPLLAEIEPLLTLHAAENWLAKAEAAEDLRFLLLQNVG